MSWEELLSIRDDAIEALRREREQPPRVCPNDANALEYGTSGEQRCPFCGWPKY